MKSNEISVKNNIIRETSNKNNKIVRFKGQIYENLRDECLRKGKLFEDLLFKPEKKNIFYTKCIPSGTVWKRPKEITNKPMFIVNGVNANDLDQGKLGNCWFIAGCAAMAMIPELFDNVVPSGQGFERSKYAGIFRFRFWLYGDWTEVVVDDRLPVKSNQLLFCGNIQEPNEFWAALLEKAYAKLCGSYENLEIGHTTDAFVDITGGIQESFLIKDKDKLEIWRIIDKSFEHGSLIGASIYENATSRLKYDLPGKHAYTV
jgi:hypothetical protein